MTKRHLPYGDWPDMDRHENEGAQPSERSDLYKLAKLIEAALILAGFEAKANQDQVELSEQSTEVQHKLAHAKANETITKLGLLYPLMRQTGRILYWG
ncbi:MAG: hypothetical protein H9535_19290 [Ignavibacteria bacterium]|nr:hypothetical protein [Ignavibacteria bacterium]